MASDSDNDAASPSHSAEDSGDQDNGDMVGDQEMEEKNGDQSKDGSQQKKASSNTKDPSRPRRKKARRACYACQRAHLTCGDERPCQRCIKRGLQDACADGVRKKAKYLHDAPNEALMPGAASHYQYMNNVRRAKQNPQSPTYPITPVNDMYSQRQQGGSFPVYGTSPSAGQVPTPNGLIDPTSYAPQQSPVTGQFPGDNRQPPTSIQNLVQAMEQPTTGPDPSSMPEYTGPLFDSIDLSQYNFDPASFNFGNHYGALEFGMLGHIASGAAETPPSDTASQLNQTNSASTFATPGGISNTYNESPVTTQPYLFNQDQGGITEWRTPSQPQSDVRQSGVFTRGQDPSNVVAKQEIPYAYPIGAGSAFTSPTSEMSPPMKNILEDSPSTKSFFHSSAPNSRPGTSRAAPVQQTTVQPQMPPQESAFPPSSALNPPGRRRGDPSAIYDAVTQPYPYTTGFHSLIAFLQKRFSSQKTLRIAKALASIRPSFIACTRTLGREDLIFMEKCFQRTLWEYEDFINASGTPTLVCRRTGEVAAVGKEFSLLTGWGKDILLGKEANLNINTGGSSGPPGTGASSRGGANTPRLPEGTVSSSRPQPVFLAELLDDDSVIEFYESFARIAFGDSRAGVTTKCKLLQYRTREDESLMLEAGEDGRPTKRQRTQLMGRRGTSGAVVEELGDKDGKVECTCCWTVKRDLFDLPMMIVMNFLPCI